MPTSMQTISDVFPRLTEYEQHIVKWQFRLLGDFETALMGAIARADDNNLMALSLGFPMQVAAYREWVYGQMGQHVRSLGLDI